MGRGGRVSSGVSGEALDLAWELHLDVRSSRHLTLLSAPGGYEDRDGRPVSPIILDAFAESCNLNFLPFPCAGGIIHVVERRRGCRCCWQK